MQDLSLVATNDMLDELVRRHDSVVLTGVKYTSNSGEYVTFRRFSGSRFVCGGLIGIVNALIAKDELAQVIPLMDNEDR